MLLSSAAAAAITITSTSSAQTAGPVRGGTLTIHPSWEPPQLVSFTHVGALSLSAKVTEGLVWFDRQLNPQPQLATAWTVSDDKLTYTFQLRRGVKWHDGRDFTAADVVYSINTLKTKHPRGRISFAQVIDVQAPDDFTVVVKLVKPTAFLIMALSAAESPIVPRHIYEGTDPTLNPANNAPIGTGPFRFKEWVRGSHASYVRNEEYWDTGKPYLDGIIARFIPDFASVAAAFEAGSLHAGFRTPVPLADIARLRKLSILNFERGGYEYSPPNSIQLDFNLDRPTWANHRVRQAIAHLIDRDAICRAVFFGEAVPSPSPVVPQLKEFHNPAPSPYPFNLAKAKQLLDEAGFKADGKGARLSAIIDLPADDWFRRLADYLRATFAQVGIAVQTRPADYGTLGKRVYGDRDFDMMISSSSPLCDPQLGVQRLYWSKNFIIGVPYSNATHYNNPEVDKLMEDAAVEADQAKRVALWKRMQEIVMVEVPSINIAMPLWSTVHNVKAHGLADTASGFEGNFATVYLTK
jgi:peptide/nickel transport system substrate-binding protein